MGFDDSLDVVGVHLVGGAIGSLLIGFLATAAVTGGPSGLLYGGGLLLLGKQAAAVAAVGAYSFAVSYLLGWLVNRTIGFRAADDDEMRGLDLAMHAESAYEFGVPTHGGFDSAPHRVATREKVET